MKQDETRKVHELLRQDLRKVPERVAVCSVAVLPGRAAGELWNPGGRPRSSALRLCASARLVTDALSSEGRGARAVVADAIAVLDKAAILASHPLS